MTDTTRERVARAIAEWLNNGLVWQHCLPGTDAAMVAMSETPQREVFVYRDGVYKAEMEPVPQSASGKACCTLCETPLDLPGRPWTRNCGGDCLACMADVGDPDCAAAMAAMQGGGWRPIESAPRDGTMVLLWRPLAAKSNDPALTMRRTTTNHRHVWEATIPPGCDGQNFTEGSCYATHWQPVPTPPSQTEETDHA